MCNKWQESNNHLFLHCEVAWQIWCCFWSNWGFEWVIPKDVVDLLASWVSKVVSLGLQLIGMLCLLLLCRKLGWKEIDGFFKSRR
ncbi:hypothetical protein SUGI_0205050 [Cryptomeria japonica]|nr:hypothetical protein SUGI_0205050 [Cryptomeria japonica]